MPVYDYVCQDCGKPFTVQITMARYSKGYKPRCPDCRSRKVVRTFTSVNVLTVRGNSGGPLGGCGPMAGPGCCGS